VLNQVTVIGRVIDMLDEKDATIVIVRTGGGQKRDGGEWVEDVACRFWSEANRKHSAKAAVGMLVRIDGSVRSREYQGKWYSNLECRFLAKLAGAPADSGARSGSRSGGSQQPSDPPPEEDKIPF
jgi:hypothetical protein